MNSNLKSLPISEKIQLVEDLWDSIASERNAVPLTPEQKAELDKRLDSFEFDGNLGRPLSEAVAEIRKKL
ncbi:MAG: addiction module protein [SAR86 cluster bacterium]|uniref:Addiction module protein n=1 Tax=SAR86 cluster bacterium TaxID=2030880 RepID=A0A2A5ARW4_9GAMM|nr:MAG: addiction module protein [SAR86 cluster bacterium]